jgi:hypothetical protein
MGKFEGLILVTGMGDARRNSTDEWAKLLFPGCTIKKSGDKKWLKTGDRKIYLFEVYYDDLNQMLLEKFEGLKKLFDSAPGPAKIKEFLETHINDVMQNVLVPDMINASQARFVEQYSKMIQTILDEGVHLSDARVGVLSHSLGTLVAYEGLYKVCDTREIIKFVDLGLVMAAPMLSPICAVQSSMNIQRYLTRNRSMKPYKRRGSKMTSPVTECVAIYNKKDPFYLIHNDAFYDRRIVNNDLVDTFIKYDEGPTRRNVNTHSMESSYIPKNRELIIKTLLGEPS